MLFAFPASALSTRLGRRVRLQLTAPKCRTCVAVCFKPRCCFCLLHYLFAMLVAFDSRSPFPFPSAVTRCRCNSLLRMAALSAARSAVASFRRFFVCQPVWLCWCAALAGMCFPILWLRLIFYVNLNLISRCCCYSRSRSRSFCTTPGACTSISALEYLCMCAYVSTYSNLTCSLVGSDSISIDAATVWVWVFAGIENSVACCCFLCVHIYIFSQFTIILLFAFA